MGANVLYRSELLRRLRRAKSLRDFVRDPSGAMAVEFAMVAAPLIFMLFAILELALVFMVSSSLENATTEVARTIRTGAVQQAGGGSQTAFRNSVCAEFGWLQSQCQSNLSVDVRTFAQFQGQSAPDPVQNGTFSTANLTYSIGQQGDIVLVRTFYQWKLVSPFLYGGLQRLSGGKTLLTAAATFKNEPY